MGTRGTRRLRNLSHEHSKGENLLLTTVDSLLNAAKERNLYDGEELDIKGLITLFSDIDIVYTQLDPSISGSLSRIGDKWIISVNKLHHKNRQRFTLGHELAHYVLHKSDNEEFIDTVFFRGLSNNNIERTANDFASRLLMPEDKVRDLIVNRNIRNVGELANLLGVSAAAMQYRVKQLGFKTKE